MELDDVVKDIRISWAKGDEERNRNMKTPSGIIRYDNLSYGKYNEENLLDIYVPESANKPLPTIVNIHGGAWVYGNKEIYQYYCMNFALKGFTVVNINYRLAPESKFPCAVEDINNAMKFIAEHGSQYLADKYKLILIGDSAGGQLVSHYATIATNPDFAGLFDFNVPDIHISALGLHCGLYDGLKAMVTEGDELFSGYYVGIDGSNADNRTKKMVDAMGHMTKDFPPSFITSAVHDFLLPEAKPMYDHLNQLGVPCEIAIYGSEDREDICHEFQLNFMTEEGIDVGNKETVFFRKYTE